MLTVYISTEGGTETEFVKQILVPHFARVVLQPVCLKGIKKSSKVLHEIRLLCRNKACYVTTMYDLYQFPFPSELNSPNIKIAEQWLKEQVGHNKFIPYFQLHEFEALLFSKVDAFNRIPGMTNAVFNQLQRISRQYQDPEKINSITSPSKRIEDVFANYDKLVHGIDIVKEIGLPILRGRCKHFDQWISQLEKIN